MKTKTTYIAPLTDLVTLNCRENLNDGPEPVIKNSLQSGDPTNPVVDDDETVEQNAKPFDWDFSHDWDLGWEKDEE